jgi:conjugative transfer region protein (TIGR03748 family)
LVKKARREATAFPIHSGKVAGDDKCFHPHQDRLMSLLTPRPALLPRRLILVTGIGVAITCHGVFASVAGEPSFDTATRTGRYSLLSAQPAAGQEDLLAVSSAVSIPEDIKNLGEAMRWLLTRSGYRLAADNVMTQDAQAMLALPLPEVHRRFEPLPLYVVLSLLVGPAFHVVQDPVHRLVAIERCVPASIPPSSGDKP